MARFLLFLALSACVYQTAAVSSGLLGYCNIMPLSQFGKGTSVMKWVERATNASFYTLRTGTGANVANDPTSYTPGVPITLNLQVLDLEKKYIGLVLYAVQSSTLGQNPEVKVGTFQIPPESKFQNPSTCGTDAVVTHKGAELKPLMQRFLWTAPAGTGTVQFRILIKQGEQNHGNFYIPQRVLTLTEGLDIWNPNVTTIPETRTVLGKVGASCTSTCSQQELTPYCHQQATAELNTSAAFSAVAFQAAACRFPVTQSCGAYSPMRDPDGFCAYKADCGNTTRVTTCSASSSSVARFCVCTSNQQMSASSTISPSLTVMLSLLFVWLMQSVSSAPRMFLVALLATTTFVAPAEAHNWISSPSRARIASVNNPCQERISDQPHIQVNAKQVFELDWSVGHGDSSTVFTYMVALHADDIKNLLDINTTVMDQWLKECPTSAKLTGTTWQKQHLAPANEVTLDTFYFVGGTPTLNTSAYYIRRDPVQIQKGGPGSMGSTSVQFTIKPEYLVNDTRCSYTNSKWPWIEAIHKFKTVYTNSSIFAHHSDLARFRLDARKGAGDYIMWFYWGGYRDCVDINVQPSSSPIVNRYGTSNASATPGWVKLDHCEFSFVTSTYSSCRKLPTTGNASACISACTGSCTGVQVVRASNPAGTMTYTPNIPYTKQNMSHTAPNSFPLNVTGPCGYVSVHKRTMAGCNELNSQCNRTALALGNSDYVCYPLIPYRDQDFQTTQDYEITDEPTDPKFYSTCWLRADPGGFINLPAPSIPKPIWSVGDKCINCEFRDNASLVPPFIAIDWTLGLSTSCRNCDRPTL